MKTVTFYRNKENKDKYVKVVRYDDGHIHAGQIMKWGDAMCRNRMARFTKPRISALLQDYTKIYALEDKT